MHEITANIMNALKQALIKVETNEGYLRQLKAEKKDISEKYEDVCVANAEHQNDDAHNLKRIKDLKIERDRYKKQATENNIQRIEAEAQWSKAENKYKAFRDYIRTIKPATVSKNILTGFDGSQKKKK